jgi:competence protein ComEA
MAVKPSQAFLYFTRKDRRGSLVLLLTVLLLSSLPFLYPLFIHTGMSQENKFDSSLANLKTKQSLASQKKFDKKEEDQRPYDEPSSASYPSKIKGTLFYFDPNTIDAAGWKKLGLRDKTIATILNFRSKGGKFRKADDIKKIWGLFPDEAERLLPYVQIVAVATSYPRQKNNYSSAAPGESRFARQAVEVEINWADTSEFIALPGIGSKLSQRIINFREKLGGFYSVEQVAETFGLPDSVFQQIKPRLQLSGEVKKININTASLDELKIHPYVKYHLANAIVQYRIQHGDYKMVADIKKIMLMTDALFDKVSPYFTIN